jgi:hypothetical protein
MPTAVPVAPPPTVQIAFSYTNDPLVIATLKEFRVYTVDSTTHARLTPAIVVNKGNIPTITMPLTVPVTGYSNQTIEVVPLDLQGKEGITTYAPVYVPLPAVTAVAQVTT